MGQIDHAHDAEDQREARCQHEQQQTVLHAVEQLNQKIRNIHDKGFRSDKSHPHTARGRVVWGGFEGDGA